MKVTQYTRDVLLEVARQKKIFVEGNFLKLLEAEDGDTEFAEYLQLCKDKDITSRRKRLDVTKQVQSQNKALEKAAERNAALMEDLKVALEQAEKAKTEAEESKAEAEKLWVDAF